MSDVKHSRLWTHVNTPPLAGGKYIVGGYVFDGVLRYFQTTFASYRHTTDGPEWSHLIASLARTPIEYYIGIPDHPERHIALDTPNAAVAPAPVNSAAAKDERISEMEANNARLLPQHIRNFLGKVQGVCMGVAMSGREHPNPDGVLMDLVTEAQAILFPAVDEVPDATKGGWDDA